MIRALYETARSVDARPPTEAVATLAERVLDLPGLDERDRAILQYVIRLTLSPRSMRASEVETLRAAGLDDPIARHLPLDHHILGKILDCVPVYL